MTTEALGATAAGAIWRRGKLANLALLIASFGAGQGTTFMVQTWLVATGRVELLAGFGTVFSFAILATLLIDFGAATVLARDAAAAVGRPNAREHVWRGYWGATAVRAMAALACAMAAFVYAVAFAGPFERSYVICALPACLVWPFNAAGLLDGMRLSGVGGVVGSAPYVLSAIMLYLIPDYAPEVVGAALGGALSAGYFLVVAGQFVALRDSGLRPCFVRPTLRDALAFGGNGGGALLIMLPGQLFFRFQVIVANVLFGVHGTALFLYAKQVVVGATQIIAMARRVELPELATMSAHGVMGPQQVLRVQRVGVAAVWGLGIAVALAGSAALLLPGSPLREAGGLVLAFSTLIVGTGYALMLTQGLVARGQYDVAWRNTFVAIATGAVAAGPLAVALGAIGLGLAELIASSVMIAGAVRALRRAR